MSFETFRLLATVLLVAACLGANASSSALFRRQHDTPRALWEADGRPIGSFFVPPELASREARRAGMWTGLRVGWRWWWATPDWISRDPHAGRLLAWNRATALVWNVGFVPMLIAWAPAFLAAP